MPISGTSFDITGRTKDVHILHGAEYARNAAVSVNMEFGRVSQFCTGIQKLVQRVLISFSTILGSQKDFPDFGTEFFQTLSHASSNPSITDLQHLFNFASLKVFNEYKSYQIANPSIPADEQLAALKLNDIVRSGDFIGFKIEISTLAGDNVTFIVPLPDYGNN